MVSALPNEYLSAARDLVLEGSRLSDTPLTEALEFRTSAALAKFMSNPIDCGMLAVRVAEAKASDGCLLGDDCLITCTIFADRLKRTGMSVSFCSEIGRSAYDLAGMTEEAYGFSFMMTAIYAVLKPTDQGFKQMLDRAAGGDQVAARALGNVTPFRKAGLLH